jgi:hypothetical protein
MNNNEISLDLVLNVTILASGISYNELKSKTRKRKITEVRHAYMIVARDFTKASNSMITSKVNRDHSTLNHALKIRNNIPNIKKYVNSISDIILRNDINSEITTLVKNFDNKNITLDDFVQNINNVLNKKIHNIFDYNNKKRIENNDNLLNLISEVEKRPRKIDILSGLSLLKRKVKDSNEYLI